MVRIRRRRLVVALLSLAGLYVAAAVVRGVVGPYVPPLSSRGEEVRARAESAIAQVAAAAEDAGDGPMRAVRALLSGGATDVPDWSNVEYRVLDESGQKIKVAAYSYFGSPQWSVLPSSDWGRACLDVGFAAGSVSTVPVGCPADAPYEPRAEE